MKRKPKPSKSSTSKKSSIAKWVKSLIAVLVSIFGIAGTYYSFQPKINIDSKSYLKRSDPSTAPFVFENQSLLSLYNVKYKFYVRSMSFSDSSDGGIERMFLSSSEPPLIEFKSGTKFTDFLVFPFRFPNSKPSELKFVQGDIDIDITYRPQYLFWPETKTQRFTTKKESSGGLRWIHAKPANDSEIKSNVTFGLIFDNKRKH